MVHGDPVAQGRCTGMYGLDSPPVPEAVHHFNHVLPGSDILEFPESLGTVRRIQNKMIQCVA